MKLTSRKDLEVPIGDAFAHLSKFEEFEQLARARGALVERLQPDVAPRQGLGWMVRFVMRGKARSLALKLVDYHPNERIGFDLDSPSFAGGGQIELAPLAERRTRLSVSLDVRPKTLAARLLVQTIKLARNRAQRKFDRATAKLAEQIEQAARRG